MSLAERAAKLAGTPAEEPKRKPAAVRTKPVQLTVTVSPELYAGLKAFPGTTTMAADTDRLSVPTVEVMRALIEELLADEDLQERIVERVGVNYWK